MNRQLLTSAAGRLCLLAGLALTLVLQSHIAQAKTLASDALAAAIENDTLDRVKQDLLMDAHQQQKYDFDESGVEDLGRRLLDRGREDLGVEILQLNQMIHHQSPLAANALGDAYRRQHNDMSARVYYNMALDLDPGNEHAAEALAEMEAPGDPMAAMGDMELDTDAMQAAMQQAGVEMTPEQLQQMQQAMDQMNAYPQDPSAMAAAEGQQAEARQQQRERRASATAMRPAPEYDSPQEGLFCEGFDRGDNDHLRIPDAGVRTRYEGNYGDPKDPLRSWNIETICHDVLFAVPLFADVQPPALESIGEHAFTDYLGDRWTFTIGADGKAESVTYVDSQGKVTTLQRLGDPKNLQ